MKTSRSMEQTATDNARIILDQIHKKLTRGVPVFAPDGTPVMVGEGKKAKQLCRDPSGAELSAFTAAIKRLEHIIRQAGEVAQSAALRAEITDRMKSGSLKFHGQSVTGKIPPVSSEAESA